MSIITLNDYNVISFSILFYFLNMLLGHWNIKYSIIFFFGFFRFLNHTSMFEKSLVYRRKFSVLYKYMFFFKTRVS